jgi:diguanylate cyclase (GGDEF)-like protein
MAFSLRQLKIRQQILMVTLPPLFVLACSIGVLFYAYWMARLSDRATRKSEESVALAQSVARQLAEMHMAVRGYVFTRSAAVLKPYEKWAPQLPAELSRLRDLESDSAAQVAAVDSLAAGIARWENEWANPLIEDVQRGVETNRQTMIEEGEGRMGDLRGEIEKLLAEDKAQNAAITISTELSMRHMLELGVGLGLLLAAVLLVLTRVATRLIAGPVEQLIDASERVSRGDFQPDLPPASENEFGQLSLSFSHMTKALRQEREELAALNKFSEAVTQCTSEFEVYDHILHSLKERFQPRQAIIFILKSPENYLEASASLLPLPEHVRSWPVIEEPRSCKAVRMGRPFMANDVSQEPLCPADFLPPSEGTYYCGPLIAGGIIIGAVRLEGAPPWTPDRSSLLEGYLSGAATALSNLRLLQTMKTQANVDELTGLYNRRFLEDYARKLLAMASRKRTPVSVIMMDLDHFKTFNDRFGHELGDRILRQFAKTVSQAMRETNLAARHGGEEFVVLLPDTGARDCLAVAERIRKAVERMVVPSGTDQPLPRITVSAGIAVYPEHGHTVDELLVASDKALYESKRTGRNRTTLYVEQTEPAG